MKLVFGVLLALCLASVPAARASERATGGRAPVRSEGPARLTELRLTEDQRVQEVRRVRTPGKSFAAFSAEPGAIARGERMVFTIRSVSRAGSVPRWRCVAVGNVSECLGKPVRISYLPDDEQMILVAELEADRRLEN